MAFEHKGREYGYLLGSDVSRDGMYIEVNDGSCETNPLIEIFYSDVTHETTMTLLRPHVPLEVIEWAIAVARKRLPATKNQDD